MHFSCRATCCLVARGKTWVQLKAFSARRTAAREFAASGPLPGHCMPANVWMVLQRDGAGNETRTRDPDLGKVVLYQLSYSRIRNRRARDSMCTLCAVKANERTSEP